MDNIRFKAVETASSREPVAFKVPAKSTSEYYGCKVFNKVQMDKYLSKKTIQTLKDTIDNGIALDRTVADHVAAGMKQWAMEMGATHYTHWFHPLTGGTAEKHDAFSEPNGFGSSMEEFSGKLLVQQEPDASSFPNGGLRNTFEARGYTAWDASSPAFIIGDTLCIPTVFISYTGEALDHKTPLLKSLDAVNKAATEVCKYFDPSVSKVTSFLGWEQEYFLVDTALFSQRPDLMLTERTLMGHESAKNQQLEDHYFGSIPLRAMAFMQELEVECYKLSIPIKTRHNEVAPNQFEVAPVYEEVNLAVDHNQILMSIMKKVAAKHHFRVLLHEKPFKGVNGSGKHCNWSLGTDTGVNLMSPGKTDEEYLRFLTFMVNVLAAVHRNNGLVKASIASASNAHRLGANEAPPAIISSFLGTQVSAALEALLTKKNVIKTSDRSGLKLNLPQIPEILMDNTDRNRTSPFAFTGNRFEFRAVGSSANCAMPMMVVNTIVAHQLTKFKKEVDEKIEKGMKTEEAMIEILQGYMRECKGICFDGNGYSEDWKKEAKKRGLDCETSVPRIYDSFVSEQSLKVFTETGVLTEVEVEARNEVWWELYSKKIEIEGRVLRDLSSNHVLPVATRYQSFLLDNVSRMKAVFSEAKVKDLAKCQLRIIEDISKHIASVRRMTFELSALSDELLAIEDEREKAIGYHDRMIPYIENIREHIDELEMIVDDQMWPLPKYREMMFIR
jgi:Uncharacterized protein related to glutamine synthetase